MGKDDSEHSNTDPKREIEVRPSRALTRPDGTEIPVLSEMVSRSLTNIEASNKLSTLHRIGDHELHSPDYRLVCAWAEELDQGVERTLDSLLDWGAEISEGRFVTLHLQVSLDSIPLIEGLEVRELYCYRTIDIELSYTTFCDAQLHKLDLTPVPKLEGLYCSRNNLAELNLTPVPNLKKLWCIVNNLTELDLTPVPNLKDLHCSRNKLAELDLTPVTNLEELYCENNNLTELDLTPVRNLKDLYCSDNYLAKLDLTPVPNLEELFCDGNNLTELDTTPVPNLKELECSDNNLAKLD